MNDEQRLILQMVQAGQITPEEAGRLLAALSPASDEPLDLDAPALPTPPAPVPPAPDMAQFRRYWEIPFFVGIVLLGVAGLCVANTGSVLLLICGWLVLALAALITLIGWLSQYSPWMHLRIHQNDGSRIAFSLPLPLRILAPVLTLARLIMGRFADDETRTRFELAASLALTLGSTPSGEPISVEIDDDDGDQVRIFVG